MGTKPDFKQISAAINRAIEIDSAIKAALDSQKDDISRLRAAAEEFYTAKFRQELERMDVELLSQGKQGIRITSLQAAGIRNIYELSSYSVPRLEALEGIGQQGAQKIHTLTKQIVENTRKKLTVRIEADLPSPADDGLIRGLYILILREDIRSKLQLLYNENHKSIQQECAAAKFAAGGLRWFLAPSSDRQLALNAAASLQGRLDSPFGDPGLLKSYQAAEAADPTACRAHFRENAAQYYAVLGTYCKQLNTENIPQTGLSQALLEAIEAQQIDLKYLNATLRPYQTFGVKYAIAQKRTLLGDEMGLGKTFQAMATMAALKAAGKHHFMVVCPASVLINWCRELRKHTQLEVTKIHGGDEEALLYWRENGDVAVTTYESISRNDLPEKFKFDMLVVDEAHYVKNPDAQRTVAMKKLLAKTDGVLYMSGTPLVNRVDEMCFLVDCLQPEIARKLEKVKAISTAEQFRQELAPVYLRRVRADVLKELPDLIEKQQWCDLSKQEKEIYREAVASGNLMAIRQVSWQMDDPKDSSKAQRLLEICESAKEEGRKIIVFSFFRNTLEKVHQLLGDRCLETISGDISPARRQEIVDDFNAADPGAVLVSQVQAGGTGLNIQAASVIVFCEPQLTPAIENQAVSRAYRMGQTRDVLVHRLLADDTIDERMLEILSGKQQEFDSFADDSVVGEGQLQRQQAQEGSWLTRMVQEEQARLAQQ